MQRILGVDGLFSGYVIPFTIAAPSPKKFCLVNSEATRKQTQMLHRCCASGITVWIRVSTTKNLKLPQKKKDTDWKAVDVR
jgi:hypothetical protein